MYHPKPCVCGFFLYISSVSVCWNNAIQWSEVLTGHISIRVRETYFDKFWYRCRLYVFIDENMYLPLNLILTFLLKIFLFYNNESSDNLLLCNRRKDTKEDGDTDNRQICVALENEIQKILRWLHRYIVLAQQCKSRLILLRNSTEKSILFAK